MGRMVETWGGRNRRGKARTKVGRLITRLGDTIGILLVKGTDPLVPLPTFCLTVF